MQRLGILGSTRGTDMLALIAAIEQKKLQSVIDVVISDKEDAMILERARSNQLPAIFLSPKNRTREEYDQCVSDILREHKVNLVVLIGFMRILSKQFVTAWHNQIINVHPSLLPAFPSMMDGDVHKAVLAAGIKETGCTVHFVTEEVDSGPIIIQKKCEVLPNDTVDSLKQRVQTLEGEALIAAIQKVKL